MTGKSSSAIEVGRALFNAGRYFDAHDAWEEAWLSESGEPRRLLQGLIQLAAAFHKASGDGSARGCVHLIDAGLSKLDGFPDRDSGLALGRLRREVRAFRALAESWRRGESPAPRPPFPKLRAALRARRRPARRASTRTTSRGGS